ncbi:SDR family oxidoreductase [Acrocarpospora sp. B8E8]|uniref:SDR family oxidoreductase n=1 Tax=Acrocarpospora sp. B8E8 TaxID=3153572 RepID=UPI00325E9F5D
MAYGVLVVVGTGGMGVAAARRIGPGKRVLLADFNEAALDAVAGALRDEGHDVTTQVVDVSSGESVHELARTAARLGPVTQVLHTAGLSPAQAPVEAILRVDLLGVALVLDEFAEVVSPGGAGLVIASMSGHLMPPPPPEVEIQLATTPTGELLNLPAASPGAFASPGHAYSFSKRANQVRVRAASTQWGRKGARVNTISPGVISTKMGRQELASPSGAFMRAMVDGSGTGRLGSPDDIASAAAFLLSDAASFITGTDLLVDGGAVAAVFTGHTALSMAAS